MDFNGIFRKGKLVSKSVKRCLLFLASVFYTDADITSRSKVFSARCGPF